ncbi:MAG: hypothetical protein PHP54_06105 [Clostridia bacterium]|nr:hypothetical protein [Clostridia bacterium]
MKKNKYNCRLCICLVILLIVLLSFGALLHQSIYVSNSSNINEQHLYHYLLEIDDILLEVYDENQGFTKESMINFSVQYILKNYDNYATQILDVEDNFLYRCNGTEYIPQGYVETVLLSKIINHFFGKENLDVTSHPYYNPDVQKFALISTRGDSPIFDKAILDNFDIINDNVVIMTLKYTIQHKQIAVNYTIYINNGQYHMQNLEICDIIG